jgi:hypothetical protein
MLQEKSKAKPPGVYCQVANIPIAAANIVSIEPDFQPNASATAYPVDPVSTGHRERPRADDADLNFRNSVFYDHLSHSEFVWVDFVEVLAMRPPSAGPLQVHVDGSVI